VTLATKSLVHDLYSFFSSQADPTLLWDFLERAASSYMSVLNDSIPIWDLKISRGYKLACTIYPVHTIPQKSVYTKIDFLGKLQSWRPMTERLIALYLMIQMTHDVH
jgi:hypothetical protein